MLSKINLYIFIQILKSCTLIFFIFVSISWLLQLTRLFTISNFVQIDVINIIYLSIFLIPNLLTVIIPFILIFGILLCFVKLNRDRELIAIYSLGLETKPLRNPLFIFSIIVIIFYIIINFYLSPKIYEQYKIKEFELRNTINFDKMIISNFIKLNDNTTLDFKKNKDQYEDIFINYLDEKENIIFAKNGLIKEYINEFVFQLNNGFKLSINQNGEIEKLEFDNYKLNIENNSNTEFNNYDINTLTIFDDLKSKNYLNISYKVFDIIICLLIIIIFYRNNIIICKFDNKNNIFFILTSISILLINQLLKNSEIQMYGYLILNIFFISSVLILIYFKKLKYV
tara:strand:- start:859 stop:1881 length:1023 start_codon:yes stop_codon:yes gene_type:complete